MAREKKKQKKKEKKKTNEESVSSFTKKIKNINKELLWKEKVSLKKRINKEINSLVVDALNPDETLSLKKKARSFLILHPSRLRRLFSFLENLSKMEGVGEKNNNFQFMIGDLFNILFYGTVEWDDYQKMNISMILDILTFYNLCFNNYYILRSYGFYQSNFPFIRQMEKLYKNNENKKEIITSPFEEFMNNEEIKKDYISLEKKYEKEKKKKNI